MFETSDEYDFTPSASSNLASLFGASMTVSDTAHASLTYTAPKQPQAFTEASKKTPTKAKQESIVVCAKVVTLYKLQDNNHDLLGKHGLALVKSKPQNVQEMIIYKEKTNIITRSKITDNFQLVIQNDSFCSFIDESSRTWILKFETPEDRVLISAEIQSLGGKVVDNSAAVLRDNNLPTPTKNRESAITNNEIPSLNQPPQDMFVLTTETKPTEEDGHSNGSESRVKADILSRMAKMGQLVMSGNCSDQTLDMSDSDTTDGKQIIKPQRKPRKLIPHRDNMGQLNNDLNTRQPVLDQCQNAAVNVACMTNNLRPADMAVATNSVAMIHPNFLEKYFIDTRRRDTDLKLNMCEISTKLDYLIKNSSLPNQACSSTVAKEDTVLKSKIKALQLQTENLNAELRNMQVRYSELQEVKIVEGENNVLSYREEVSKLESDLQQMKLDLDAANARCQSECEQYKERFENLGKKLEKEKTINIELNEKLKMAEAEIKEDKKASKLPELVKQRMSNLYEDILSSFQGNLSKDAENHISSNIRNTALMIIKDLQDK